MLSKITKVFGNTFIKLKSLGVKTNEKLSQFSAGTLFLVFINFCLFTLGYNGAFTWKDLSFHPDALATYMFTHYSWDHVIGNMFLLSLVGMSVEKTLGTIRYLTFYFLCGIIGVLAYAALMPLAVIAGASAAVSGVMAMCAFVQTRWTHTILVGIGLSIHFTKEFFRVMVDMVLPLGTGTAHLAHLVGAIVGCFCVLFHYKNLNKQLH
jgi:membrane associated rhomboid family serine protease